MSAGWRQEGHPAVKIASEYFLPDAVRNVSQFGGDISADKRRCGSELVMGCF